MQGQLLLYFFYSQTCLRVGGDFINTLGIFQIYSLSPLKKKNKQNLSFTISKAEVERRLKIETNMHIFGIFVMKLNPQI